MESQPPVPPYVPPSLGGPPPPPPPAAPVDGLPWERPGAPFANALFETTKLLLLRPREAYERMSLVVSPWRPLTYALLLGFVGILFTGVYNLAFGGVMREFFWRYGGERSPFAPVAFFWVNLICSPLWITLGALISAAIIHLCLMILGGASRGFGATFRVVCYASAPQLLTVVPFCGWVASAIWAVVLLVIGLAVAHRTTQTRALIAVLLPGFVLCACATAIGAIFGAVFRHLRG